MLLVSVTISVLLLEIGLRLWDGAALHKTENFVARELDVVVSPKISTK